MSNIYFPDSDDGNTGLMAFAGPDANDGFFEIIATKDDSEGNWNQVDMYGDGYYLTKDEAIALRDFLIAALEESENV